MTKYLARRLQRISDRMHTIKKYDCTGAKEALIEKLARLKETSQDQDDDEQRATTTDLATLKTELLTRLENTVRKYGL